MLEKFRILRALNIMRKKRIPFSDTEFRNRAKIFNRPLLEKTCAVLHRNGYFDQVFVDRSHTFINIELSYQGMTYIRHWELLVLKYIADHWLDFLAVVISFLALLRS